MMKHLSVRCLTSLLLLASALPAAAQETDRLNAIAREAARRFDDTRRADAQARQTAPVGVPAVPPAPMVNITVDEATQRALERNLDIAVERLNPQTYDFALSALQANYRPTLTSRAGLSNITTFSRSQTSGAPILQTETVTGNAGYAQNLKRGGGSYAVSFNNSRLSQTDQFALRNPTLSTGLNAVAIQPLMRGFRIDTTRASLLITKLNQDMSEIAVRGEIVATLANVRDAYWDLVFAIQAVDVAQRSLSLASKLVEDNQARVEVGTLAPIDVVQAQSEEALRKQAVVQADATRRTAELALKRLVVNGTDDPLWSASLNPVDRPSFAAEALDVQGAVRRALDNRTDLQQSKKLLQANDVTIRSLRDLSLPAVDLTANYGASGIGGPQFVRSGLGGTITQTIPSGFSDALGTLGRLTAPQWSLSVNVSYPIGTSPSEANLARSRVQKEQTIAQEKQIELQIATEVTNAALQVTSSLERYQAATVSSGLQQKRLDAEQSKFEVGMSTNFFVVQAQRDLADAQNTELRALLDYRKALVDFQRVQEAPSSGRTPGTVTIVTTGGAATATVRAAGGGGTTTN